MGGAAGSSAMLPQPNPAKPVKPPGSAPGRRAPFGLGTLRRRRGEEALPRPAQDLYAAASEFLSCGPAANVAPSRRILSIGNGNDQAQVTVLQAVSGGRKRLPAAAAGKQLRRAFPRYR